MKENQAYNVRITRSRAAKAAANGSFPVLQQLPVVPALYRKSKNKRVATEDPDVTGTDSVSHPIKKRAVLAEIINDKVVNGFVKNTAMLNNATDEGVIGKTKITSSSIRMGTHDLATGVDLSCVDPEDLIADSDIDLNKENEIDDSLGLVTGNRIEGELQKFDAKPKQSNAAVNHTAENILTERKPLTERQASQSHKFVLNKDRAESQTVQLKTSKDTPWHAAFVDIDTEHGDPQMCTTYVKDIYANLRVIELKKRPLTNFMDSIQDDINADMRSILIDWLVEVSEEYKLVPDTLYLTVNYIDRFLSGNAVQRQQLQLVGVTCMLVAAKYEEIRAPNVEEFCYITDNTYTRDEVLSMEMNILNNFQYNLTTPTTKTFLRRFVRAAQASCKLSGLHLEFLGNYLAELTLLEYDFLQFLPSLIAASSVFVAKVTLDPTVHPWNPTLQHYSGYKASELKACVHAIHELQLNKNASNLTAVREKYRQHKFKSVASLTPQTIINPQFFDDISVPTFKLNSVTSYQGITNF